MKAKYLFPYSFKWIGMILAVPGLILGYLSTYTGHEIKGFGFTLRDKPTLFQPVFENFTNELAIVLTVVGLLFIAFSKLRREDELTAVLRLDALHWAVLFNYCLFIFLIIVENVFPPEVSVINPLDSNGGLVFNIYMPLVIFIVRYHYLLYRNKDNYVVPKLWYLPALPYKRLGRVVSIVCLVLIVWKEFGPDFPRRIKPIAEGAYFLLIPALICWGFSKERSEDEAITQLRLESLQLAVYLNFILLLIFNFTIFGLLFLVILVSYFFSLLLFFVLIFEYKKYRFLKQEEKQSIEGGSLA